MTALGSLSTLSQSVYLSCLNRLAQFFGAKEAALCPWEKMQPSHVAALRAWLKHSYSPSTVNVHLSALACIVKACWRQSLITAEQRDKLLDFKREQGTRELAGRALTNAEIAALFESCKDRREVAMLAVLYSCGLRRTELASLKLSDLRGAELRVIGKRDKERKIFLNLKARAYVEAYIEERGTEPGPLFMKGDGTEFSDKAIYRLCKRLHRRAGVSAFTPHDLRRSMVSNLLDAGVDLPTVQGIAGHATPQMTARYDRRKDIVKQKASELLFVP